MTIDTAGQCLVSNENFAKKCQHCVVELFGSLQRGEMTYSGKTEEFRIWNCLSDIFGMFGFDKLIILTLYNCDGDADLCKLLRRIIWLGFLHQAHCVGEPLKLVWRFRQLSIVFCMPAEASVEDGIEFEFLRAARVHVAAKEEDTRNPVRRFHGEDHSSARAVAPAHNSGFGNMQAIHYS